MEGRIRSLLLSCIYFSLTIVSLSAHCAELEVEQVTKPVIQPEIERMDFQEARINVDSIEVILSFGLLSIEDFGTNSFLGAKLAYRVSENFFVDAEFGSSKAGQSSFDISNPGLPVLSTDDKNYSFYLINIGYDIFPGESFVTRNTTFNTAFYLISGAGNTKFAGGDNFTFSWGFGYRVVANNYMTAYFDLRDHTFELDVFGDAKRTNNIEISLGVGFYF
ncbi:hypothetical protein MNBD_GAMMA09-2487 [hydrothermal vent metagenome]|uniref:Outer membrane beta-barrel domain-containing protein n=1 Tax=hydrothermal vent metagenome TaxID=652676 RepID=A0A3B0Y075_9ZZZZ